MATAKYRVPEGGRNAAFNTAARLKLPISQIDVQEMCLAFIRWQSENPPVPTDEQRVSMSTGEPLAFNYIATEWVRRMYLAEPEISDVDRLEKAVVSVLNQLYIPGLGNEENGRFLILRAQAKRLFLNAIKEMRKPSEPEVPEAVKDLIPAIGTPHRDEWTESLTEAYRRGQKEGK